jgi:hypothetical protein
VSDPVSHNIDRTLERLETFKYWMESYFREHADLAMDTLKQARARIEELSRVQAPED